MGTRDEDAGYLAAREEQERRMAAEASDRPTAGVHLALAEQYAERLRRLAAAKGDGVGGIADPASSSPPPARDGEAPSR